MKLSRERLNALTTAAYERAAAELQRSCDGARCAALCRRLNGVIGDEVEALEAAGAGVACAPGCDFCCHLRVDVFRHEAVALLHRLRTGMAPDVAAAIEERIVANAQRVDAMTPEQHRVAGLACAFLVGGRCSAHDVRPSACAAYHSMSRERCEQSFREPLGIGTARNTRPALLELQVLGSALIEATQAGCAAARRPSEQAELHQSLRELLTSAEPL